MKFDITPREAIELNHVLKSHIQSCGRKGGQEIQGSQEYEVICILQDKLQHMILDALHSPRLSVDPMAAWVKNQKSKIEKLSKINCDNENTSLSHFENDSSTNVGDDNVGNF